jgi:hypothetical protein
MNMNLTKYIGTALVLGALASGCERGSNLEAKVNEPVGWGLPKACHASHSDGEVVNGLTRAQDCHAGHFCSPNKYIIQLPEGQLPTAKDYQKVTERR